MESPRAVSRRRFLGTVGLTVGVVAVAGAGGTTWQAVEQGVFSAEPVPPTRRGTGGTLPAVTSPTSCAAQAVGAKAQARAHRTATRPVSRANVQRRPS